VNFFTWRLMLERVRAASQGVRLRVGYAPSLASGLPCPQRRNFAQKHPNARVELFRLSTKEMLDRTGKTTPWMPCLTVGWTAMRMASNGRSLYAASWRWR